MINFKLTGLFTHIGSQNKKCDNKAKIFSYVAVFCICVLNIVIFVNIFWNLNCFVLYRRLYLTLTLI